ncbi:PAS domain-containing sensor histidine kinase [Flavobacterium franklandianum]|uniref:histidine kinase n=1 Tax=Flavobacterium franklandianum TaxID=2594430 RepID=A0A553CTB3_9FLAO|nr:PAS domain-containing sensor histidine kinase [Flavobacterium franklandianum]TRX23753.1 PAS domain-containing sensor histidine kinase [Flavobacterium franklandianum]
MELDFKTLYHHAPCGYLYTMEDGTLIDVNDTFLAFTGYSREEIIENKRFEDFLSIGGKIYYETHFAPLLHMRGEVSQISFDFIRKDETRFPVLINAIKQSANEKQHNYIQFIVLDITQRKQYEMELMNAKRKSDELLTQLSKVNAALTSNIQVIAEQSHQLEKLNATKDKFFSIVAHDLKSPLISLKSFSNLLIDHFDSFDKEDILTMSKQLNDSVDSTIKMADNLITWAMVQMGESQFNEETIKVKDITSNIFDVYQKVALEKGINVSFSVDDSLTIIGDKNQIEFIIRNLVNNAIKFTHKNGFVSLTAKSLPDGLVKISVSDSGVGISDEIKRELFSISKKQNTNGTDGENGTGLGLMLSYEFMKLNGGQIDIESSLGKGSTFHTKFKSGH